jgi:8-oxo-dGTP pyrophosphatase MutT (NUDIX family)
LAELALALRRLGLCGPWRNELIDLWALPPSEPLTGEAPPSSVALGDDASPFQHRVGRIERAAARVLGLQTQAVHLVGFAPDGRVWLQQRALSKPDDPGLWDTLVGGLVPADESLDLALARESMEEAGLALDGLAHWAWAGAIDLRHATRSGGHPGWVRERVHWARGTLHAGQVPANQDGEVAQFDLVHPADLIERMAAGLLTRTATAILRAALLAPAGSGRQDDSR